jgi:hypothetical protein
MIVTMLTKRLTKIAVCNVQKDLHILTLFARHNQDFIFWEQSNSEVVHQTQLFQKTFLAAFALIALLSGQQQTIA